MSKKPDFTKSPALAFISSAAEQAEGAPESDNTPRGMKLNPEYIEKYIEKRTKRVQIVMQPSLFDKAKAKADSRGTSLNDYIHKLIEADNK